MVEFKEKRQQEKESHIQGTSYKAINLFLSRKLQNTWEWDDIIKVLKGKSFQPSTLYPRRLLFRMEENIKEFLQQPKI